MRKTGNSLKLSRCLGFWVLCVGLWLGLAVSTQASITPPSLSKLKSHVMVKSEPASLIKTRQFYAGDFAGLKAYLSQDGKVGRDKLKVFLEDCCGFIAHSQLKARPNVQAPPEIEEENIDVHRPLGYGKALVRQIKLSDFHLNSQSKIVMDVKGVGTMNPIKRDHKTGVLTLEQAKREFFYEKLVELVFIHAGSEQRTLRTLGILSTGFNVHSKHSNELVPGGILIREAHLRGGSRFPGMYLGPVNVGGIPRTRNDLEIYELFATEFLFRRYGLTTAGKGIETEKTVKRRRFPRILLNREFHDINIQKSYDGRLLDFGSMKHMENFALPVVLRRAYLPKTDWKTFLRNPGAHGNVERFNVADFLLPDEPRFVKKAKFKIEGIDVFLQSMQGMSPEEFECKMCAVLTRFHRQYELNRKSSFLEQCNA